MKKKILVVDDTQFFRDLVSNILTKQGHEVQVAEDGFQALSVLASFIPDIIFVDLIMPKISGDKLCQLIRKMPTMKNCFIVVVSAAVSDKLYDYEKIGADACIDKESQKDFSHALLEAVKASEAVVQKEDISDDGYEREDVEAIQEITQELVSKSYYLESVLETIPEGVMEISSGKVTYATQRALELFDTSLEDMQDRQFTDLFSEEMQSDVRELIESESDPSDTAVSKTLSVDGKQVVLKVVSDRGDPHTRLVVLVDKTKQKEVEQALNEAITYNENIINSMAGSLIVLNPDLRINFVNRATCKLLEYTDHELFDKPIEDIFEDDPSFTKRLLTQLSETGTVKFPSIAYRTKSGEKIPVSFIGTLMQDEHDEKGHMRGIICIAYDLRDIEALQAQVSHAEKMAATGVLSAGVAHEIKNPLAIIVQGVEALEFALSTSMNRKSMRDMIGRIKDAAERADIIVRGLLDFSRQSSAAMTTLLPAEIIDEALTIIESQLPVQNIRVVRRYSSDTPPIKGDKNQLQQVFINLVVNAIDAMPRGGTITIETGPEDETEEGVFARVLFSDTGTGIPKEKIQDVFEPFFTTKSDNLGTGLGLSVSKGIIEKHGGTMALWSEPDEGTKVTLRLPCI